MEKKQWDQFVALHHKSVEYARLLIEEGELMGAREGI